MTSHQNRCAFVINTAADGRSANSGCLTLEAIATSFILVSAPRLSFISSLTVKHFLYQLVLLLLLHLSHLIGRCRVASRAHAVSKCNTAARGLEVCRELKL